MDTPARMATSARLPCVPIRHHRPSPASTPRTTIPPEPPDAARRPVARLRRAFSTLTGAIRIGRVRVLAVDTSTPVITAGVVECEAGTGPTIRLVAEHTQS